MQWKINWTRDLLTNGKTSLSDFKVTTPKNPLINNQVVTSIRNLTNYPWPIPKYQPTVESLLQYLIGLDLVVVFFPLMHKLSICDWSFARILSMWLTLATWTDFFGCKVFNFINNEDLEALGYKTLWRTNVVASHREYKSFGLCIRVWRPLK